jgi:hypothetical protein
MKRIISGCILFGIFTVLFILDIIEGMMLAEIVFAALVWYGLTGWMVIAGVRSLNKADKEVKD